MVNMWTIARRELFSFFYSPIAYVVLCVFAILGGFIFLNTSFAPGEPASLRGFFVGMVWALIPILPAISMRLVSEELRSGTIETLMTSPVGDVQVILGKWLGGLMFFAALLAMTLVYVVLLATWSEPDYGPIFSGYLGLLLVGGVYVAIGVFASAMTKNQIIASILTIIIILFFTIFPFLLEPNINASWRDALSFINILKQFEDFSKGLFDLSRLVYFISGIFLFLVMAVKLLESRKWR